MASSLSADMGRGPGPLLPGPLLPGVSRQWAAAAVTNSPSSARGDLVCQKDHSDTWEQEKLPGR